MSNVGLAVQRRENTPNSNFELSFCNRPCDLGRNILLERGVIREVLLLEIFTLLKIYFVKQLISDRLSCDGKTTSYTNLRPTLLKINRDFS